VHRECARSWFKWLFRVSRIFVCEGCGNQDWLTALSPGVVVHAATGVAFLLCSFFTHLVLNSIVCLFPIGMVVLCSIRINFFVVLFRGVFHWDDPFLALLSDPFFSYFVLKPLSDSSRFPLGGSACGVLRDLVNFPFSSSSSSCLPTFPKISIQSSSVANEKWDRRRNISCRSLLSTRTLHAISVSPALMFRFARRSR